MTSEQRKNTHSSIPFWENRGHMVSHALSKSLSWFAFVNASYALMVYLQDVIFSDFNDRIAATSGMISLIDMLMLSILLVSAAMILLAFLLKVNHSPRVKNLLALLLLVQGLLWAVSCYSFSAYLQLSLSYPLVSILMMSALAALYYYPKGLLLFQVPVLVATVLGNLHINHRLDPHFAVICLIFTLILIFGRYILQGWFD
ncbi:membrane-associated sensor domain-containing protein, partial [Erwinia sp.]|uniref:membrane-associated sensor domain-containing protein n=1 Tax=Erwinia citreus TaxID=558 RepID=UPI003C758F22